MPVGEGRVELMADDQVQGYNGVAKALHWIVAFCVLAAIPLGLAMVSVDPGPVQNTLYDLHRSFGALILGLMLVRVGWRLIRRPPPRNIPMPVWQSRVASTVHALLYVLLLAMPLLGWAGTSAFPATITVFWLFDLPPLVGPDRALSETLLRAHTIVAFIVSGLICLHIGAALYHHFVRKDAVLRRMLPGMLIHRSGSQIDGP